MEMKPIIVMPKPDWKMTDLIQFLQQKCGSKIQLCTVLYGKVTKFWRNTDSIADIDPRETLIAYEILDDKPDQILVELNMFKQIVEQRNKTLKITADILQKC